jgi:hypothetical protein
MIDVVWAMSGFCIAAPPGGDEQILDDWRAFGMPALGGIQQRKRYSCALLSSPHAATHED